MQFKDLKLSLKENVKPCYLLSCGSDNEDLFLKASCINNIKNAVLTDFIDLNLNIFTNENLDVNSFKKSLETLPFLSDKKLILIKENETIKNNDIINLINDFLKTDNNHIVLVIDMCVNSGFSALEKNENVCVVDCSRLERKILNSYILKNCALKNINIEEKAIEKLIDYTDGYMVNIDIELNKLISFKFEEKIITVKNIEENVIKSDEYKVYELTNALINKNGDKALFIVDDIIKNKKNVSSILPLIYNQIRRMFYVKISKDSALNLSKQLDIKEFAVKKLKEQTSLIPAKKLKELLVLCKDSDYKIKSGNLDLTSGIYNLVFSMLV